MISIASTAWAHRLFAATLAAIVMAGCVAETGDPEEASEENVGSVAGSVAPPSLTPESVGPASVAPASVQSTPSKPHRRKRDALVAEPPPTPWQPPPSQ